MIDASNPSHVFPTLGKPTTPGRRRLERTSCWLEHQHFFRDRTRERLIRSQHKARDPASSNDAEDVSRECRGLFFRERRIRVLTNEYLRGKSEGTSEPYPRTLTWGKHSRLPAQIVRQSHFRGQLRDPGAQLGGQVFHRDRKRERQILFDRELLDEHGSIGEQTELIECRQPAIRIGNGRCRCAEAGDFAAVRQDGPGDQIDEDLGHHLIESEERDGPAGVKIELGDPQRPKAVVILRHPTQANEHIIRRHVGAAPR